MTARDEHHCVSLQICYLHGRVPEIQSWGATEKGARARAQAGIFFVSGPNVDLFLRAIAECFARVSHRLSVRQSVCSSVTPWH